MVFKAYFGRDIKGIATVTRKAFDFFLRKEVDSKIKAYNVTDSTGTWDGTKEEGFVLEVLVKGFNASHLIGHQLTRIANLYCQAFNQDAVLITKQEIDAVFITG